MKLAVAIDLWTLQQIVDYSVLHGDTDEGTSALTQSQMKKKCNKQREIVPYQHLTNANG
jgi:hypothetical protein